MRPPCLLLFAALVSGFAGDESRADEPQYQVADGPALPDGADGRILHFDESTRQLYVGGAEAVTVWRDGAQVATLPADRSDAFALAIPLREGYIADAAGAGGRIVVFTPGSGQEIYHIPLGMDRADFMAFEPRTTRLLVLGGDRAVAIDAASHAVLDEVSLPAPAGGVAADGSGRVFASLPSLGQVAVIDARREEVTDRWSVGDSCLDPGPLAIDNVHRHLFVACRSGQLVLLDGDYGAIETSLDIPKDVGALLYDAASDRVFAADAGGSLLTIGPDEPGGKTYSLLAVAPTRPGASGLALDAPDHRLFMVAPAVNDNPAHLLSITGQ